MTLIRGGHQSIHNCPVCLVSFKDLTKLEEKALSRTQESTMEILKMADQRNKTDGEALLKGPPEGVHAIRVVPCVNHGENDAGSRAAW